MATPSVPKTYIAKKALFCGGELLSTKAPFELSDKQLSILKASKKMALVSEVKETKKED